MAIDDTEAVKLLRLRLQARAQIVRSIAAVVLALIRWGCLVGFMYFLYRGVDCLAGRQTNATIAVGGDFSLKLFANRYAASIVFFVFGTGGVAYGHGYRRLYQKAVIKLKRVKKYEQQLDPNRSSTGLEQGDRTNDEDLL